MGKVTWGTGNFLNLARTSGDPSGLAWYSILLGYPVLGIWYWCTDQVIVQRVLSAKDEGHAKAGTIFAGFLKVLPVFILVLPGLIALALYPSLFHVENGHITNGDIAYPEMVVRLLPTGLVGLMIAALLAAPEIVEQLAQVAFQQIAVARIELLQLMEDVIGDLTAVPQPIEVQLFCLLGVMSRQNGTPETASRPFDVYVGVQPS